MSSCVWESIHLESSPECQIKMLMDELEAVRVINVECRLRTISFEDLESMELPLIPLIHLMYF